jgi:GT2 family glycosyltransferase
MSEPRLSIVIPYKKRLENLRAVFASLAEQTLPRTDFEVVVGVMEYCPDYVTLCREYTDRLTITSILVDEEWNTSRARNLGIRHASGQVLVVLDADVILAPECLANLYRRHYRHGQQVCVLGQVVGYENVVGDDVTQVEALPYAHYGKILAGLGAADRAAADPRWAPETASAFARFPWAFAKTGLMALPLAALRELGLLLDEGFLGWGPEDQEWALRIARTGMPIVLGQDVYGMHLPHLRDFAAQDHEAGMTNKHYLAKWPRLDLELALAFGGWLEADRIYDEIASELAHAAEGGVLGAVTGRDGDREVIVLGVTLDERNRPVDETGAGFGDLTGRSATPLTGFALPYEDGRIGECRILPPITRLSARCQDAIRREAGRVARSVVPA